MAPRLLQSVFAAVGDPYLYRLSKLIFNGQVAQWTVSLNSNPYACIFFVMHRQLQLLDLNDPVQLFCQLVNWFMFFCITRTLSNSLETVLTVAGLYYWFTAMESSRGSSVDSQRASSRKMALTIAALACAVRPTSAITWIYVGLLDFIHIKSKCRYVFLEVVPVG
jgi:GPI mannosyltransferase 3